ncbi:protein RALF-like 33 [Dendrobium catenatum]|uniref:protein RALF-like 33 n=1 Tax=Dendrobium catenatum TaxID=906689 RepID=UPI0009F53CA0|nr:protein RALF-like 33 [Dendrobium catenatum]
MANLEKKKKKTPTVIFSILLLQLILLFLQSQAISSSELNCRRSAGECEWEAEAEMESETSRRMLWGTLQKHYISYAVLRRDRVPCDRPGTPYYSCHGNGEPKANPYVRGCSIIAGCRQGSP